jgi:hypothetical protein
LTLTPASSGHYASLFRDSPYKLAAASALHLLKARLVDVARMRIELAEQAVDRRFDQLGRNSISLFLNH